MNKSRATHQFVTFAFRAAFPSLAHRLRWPTRLRGWPLLAYVAFWTLLRFSVLELARSFAAEDARMRALAREELGHEPTAEEWRAFLEASGIWLPPEDGSPSAT